MSLNIKISEWTKELLDEFKKAEEHTSLDSVIRTLIPRALFEKDTVLDGFGNEKLTKMTLEEYNKLQQGVASGEIIGSPMGDYKEFLKKRIRGEIKTK